MLLLFAALAIVWTWPLGAYLTSRIPHDPGDPVLNTWLLWWNAQVVPFTEAWWDPPFFHPMRGALALSEHLAGIGLFSTPVQLAGGGAVLGYNVALLLSYALSGFFAYLLVRRLTGSPLAGLCAGLAYAFAPFRAGQLAHLQVLTSQWLPLQLLALHAYVETGRVRWLPCFAFAYVIQGLSNGYYLLFAPVLIGLWLAWFVGRRREWRHGAAILAVWAGSIVLLLPGLIKYRQVHQWLGLTRMPGEMERFSARPGSFLNPPHMLAFWPHRDVPTTEDFLFPGVTVVALAAAGLLVTTRRRRPDDVLLFYVLAALITAVLTFGPGPADAGAERWLRPYAWLALLPGFDALRVPARFAMLSTLCLAVAAGVAASRVAPARRAARWLFAGVVVAGIGADGWMEPLPLVAPPGRIPASDLPRGAAVLELPPDDTFLSVAAMYRGMFHGLPVVNGYSGHFPPHHTILSLGIRRYDPSAILELARGRPLVILIADRSDPSGNYRLFVERIPGVQRRAATSAGTMYVVPAQPRERMVRGGTPLDADATAHSGFTVTIDLKSQRVVRTLEMAIGRGFGDLGVRLRVEVSDDGAAWRSVAEEGLAGPAIAGALEDPRSVPVRILLPDVQARYLRLHPVPAWVARRVRLFGP